MHYVVTWEGYSSFLDQHVERHVQFVAFLRPVRLMNGDYVKVCRHLGYFAGKKEQVCAMCDMQGGESLTLLYVYGWIQDWGGGGTITHVMHLIHITFLLIIHNNKRNNY